MSRHMDELDRRLADLTAAQDKAAAGIAESRRAAVRALHAARRVTVALTDTGDLDTSDHYDVLEEALADAHEDYGDVMRSLQTTYNLLADWV